VKPLNLMRTGSLLCLAVLLTGVGSTLAASNRVVPTGSETCAVTPNPVNNGQQYFVTGTGYKPGQVLSVFVGSGTILMTAADANGAFSTWSWATFAFAGTKDVKVYQQGDRKKTVLASCSFIANGTVN
jgi:hypothetical protein